MGRIGKNGHFEFLFVSLVLLFFGHFRHVLLLRSSKNSKLKFKNIKKYENY